MGPGLIQIVYTFWFIGTHPGQLCVYSITSHHVRSTGSECEASRWAKIYVEILCMAYITYFEKTYIMAAIVAMATIQYSS